MQVSSVAVQRQALWLCVLIRAALGCQVFAWASGIAFSLASLVWMATLALHVHRGGAVTQAVLCPMAHAPLSLAGSMVTSFLTHLCLGLFLYLTSPPNFAILSVLLRVLLLVRRLVDRLDLPAPHADPAAMKPTSSVAGQVPEHLSTHGLLHLLKTRRSQKLQTAGDVNRAHRLAASRQAAHDVIRRAANPRPWRRTPRAGDEGALLNLPNLPVMLGHTVGGTLTWAEAIGTSLSLLGVVVFALDALGFSFTAFGSLLRQSACARVLHSMAQTFAQLLVGYLPSPLIKDYGYDVLHSEATRHRRRSGGGDRWLFSRLADSVWEAPRKEKTFGVQRRKSFNFPNHDKTPAASASAPWLSATVPMPRPF